MIKYPKFWLYVIAAIVAVMIAFSVASCGEKLDIGDYDLTVYYLSGNHETYRLHNCSEPIEEYHYGNIFIYWYEFDNELRQRRFHKTPPISHYKVHWLSHRADY